MPLYAFSLVAIAATFHALWNFALKKVSGNFCTLWIGLCFSSIISLPAAIIAAVLTSWSVAALPYTLASGVIHAFYFFFSALAYKKGDISIVYPIARGTGVAGTSILAYFFFKETITHLGFFAIASIVTGIALIGLKISKESNLSIVYALLEGLMIVGYSLNDKLGVGLLNPIIFISIMDLVTAMCLMPYVLYYHRDSLKNSWEEEKKYSLIIGLGSLGTYLLILFAFRLGQVSYVVAAREFSVAIGSVLGFVFFKEPYTLRKGLGIAAITMGLILTKVA